MARLTKIGLLLVGVLSGLVTLSAWTHAYSELNQEVTIRSFVHGKTLLLWEEPCPVRTDDVENGYWWQSRFNRYNPLDPWLWNATGTWQMNEKIEVLAWVNSMTQCRQTMGQLVEERVLSLDQVTPEQKQIAWLNLKKELETAWKAWINAYWEHSLAPLFQTEEAFRQQAKETHQQQIQFIEQQYRLTTTELK